MFTHNLRSWSVVTSIFISICLREKFVNTKTQFLYDTGKGLSSSSNYRVSSPTLKKPLTRVPQHLQGLHFDTNDDKDVIRIIDPPAFRNQTYSNLSSQKQRISQKEKETNFLDESQGSMAKLLKMYPMGAGRPTAAFLIQPELENVDNVKLPPLAPKSQHQKHYKPTLPAAPLKLGGFHKAAGPLYPVEGVSYHFATHQFYPLKVSAAVRHKQIIRTRPTPKIPHTKQRVRLKKSQTFQSKMAHQGFDFEEELEDRELGIVQSNDTTRHRRVRRYANSQQQKSVKVMRGDLLPVALTIMKENGELLTGRALLQHITVLLKNISTHEPKHEGGHENDYINLIEHDVILNEKDFNRVMDTSTNLTDQMMLNVLGVNLLNDSSLLTNTYVNEYLNCIDSSKGISIFKTLQNKFDCMKRKMFDNSNYDSSDSSRYSITNLPAELVYADVMKNIKNLVRPKNGIAFYSLPVDELTHLQQVVLPVEEYLSQMQSSRFAPRTYYNPKVIINQNVPNYQSYQNQRMPIYYVVKPDGRIYQTKENRNSNPKFFNGFPDIPNADSFVESALRNPFFESVFYD